MNAKLIIPVVLLIFGMVQPLTSDASEVKYRFDDIPKSLLKDAKAVVRNEEILVEVNPNGKVVKKVKYAITILNKNGKSNGFFLQTYDKFHKVSDIKFRIFDASGYEINKGEKLEILDYALTPEGSTYYDGRIKAITPESFEYPYTMEYSYTVTYNEIIQYPAWTPVYDYEISVEHSKFTLSVSRQAECRQYEKNIVSKASISQSDENTVSVWELSGIPAYADENFSPPLENITPSISLAPSNVKVEGYEGNLETWQGFGQWINKLNLDRDNLSPETTAKIRKLTEDITDPRLKIKAVYEYMQNRTRYISVTVGIGGYQPINAETVDRLAYGDCKALSNYTKALLQAAGIRSCYTLVNSGAENTELLTDFPSTQFNHAILCVPLPEDTIWLECTSQRKPFNYLGISTNDRYALVVDNEGGKLVRTPVLPVEKHLKSRSVNFSLNEGGSGIADVRTVYRGSGYDAYVPILTSDQADRKKMVTRKIHLPNFELDNFTITESKTEFPYVTEKLYLTVNNYCTKVGEKMILSLNMMNKLGESPFEADTRKTPVSFIWPVYEIDTVTYTLPQGYTLEKIPAKVILQSDFGKYTTEITKTGSVIQYVRTFEIYKGVHPVERYNDIVTFFDNVVTFDENKVMLTKIM